MPTLPLVAWCADGDTFMANTVEGVAITIKVISEANKQCLVGIGFGDLYAVIDKLATGSLVIPSVVNDYYVTSIGGRIVACHKAHLCVTGFHRINEFNNYHN